MPGPKRTIGGVLGGFLGIIGLSAIAGVLVTATVTPAIAVSGYAASSTIDMFDALPSYLKPDQPMEPSHIYAKNADGSDFLLTTYYDQNRIPVTYDEVAPIMYDSLISVEDRRYYEHGGIDLLGTARAALTNFQSGSSQGGSSISQQYVKNVQIQKCEKSSTAGSEEWSACYGDATQATGTEGLQRKLQELRYAVSIEQQYSKEDIVLGYLNLVNFGGMTYGIEAAAEHYFDTSAKDLTLSQAATLAGIVTNPNRYRFDMPEGSYTPDGSDTAQNSEADGYKLTLDRRNTVLDALLRDGKITQEAHDEAAAEPIDASHITDTKVGCGAAGGSAYYCQYVLYSMLTEDRYADLLGTADDYEDVFGHAITGDDIGKDWGDDLTKGLDDKTDDEKATIVQQRQAILDSSAQEAVRLQAIKRGGLDIYTSLDFNVQMPAEAAITSLVPTYQDGMYLGAATASIEASTGRILSITQNTTFKETGDADLSKGQTGLVFAADSSHNGGSGFSAGSTYKIFTLIDWLENGRSTGEVLNAVNKTISPFTICGVSTPNYTKIGNFNNQTGYTGNVKKFTADSLNSGFLTMAQQLDICDINKVAERFGVTLGNGGSVTAENVPNNVIGDKAIAPLAMASVYATIGNDGIRCEPHAIDRIVDADGNDVDLPETTCERIVESNIAATAADALEGVMASGGTGALGNPGDGTELIGKTGTHEDIQTMIMESSTAAATGVWVGNIQGYTGESSIPSKDEYGNKKLSAVYPNGTQATQIRYALGAAVQGAVDAAYPGAAFPEPDPNLTKQVIKDVPDVTGMTTDDAIAALQSAGFQAVVGDEVNGSQPEGRVESYDPSGTAPANSVITLHPSNGKGSEVPDVSGASVNAAYSALRAAGFEDLELGSCSEDESAGNGRATGTDPSAGTVASTDTTIKINYESKNCP
ncbi:MAG: transglycosylase domain-containing protein [Microbacterium sp.]